MKMWQFGCCLLNALQRFEQNGCVVVVERTNLAFDFAKLVCCYVFIKVVSHFEEERLK